MLKNLKKVLILSAVAFLFLGIGTVSAHSRDNGHHDNERPKIEKVYSNDRHSAVIKFKYKADRGEKVSVKVRVINKKTGCEETRKYKHVKINCDGRASLRVDCLRTGADYCFKVKVKGPCDCDYSCNSKCKCVTVDP